MGNSSKILVCFGHTDRTQDCIRDQQYHLFINSRCRLPVEQRNRARQLGVGLAMFTRLALLFSIVWAMSLIEPWFSIFGNEMYGREIILILGGLFLLGKSTHEIHSSLEITHRTEAVTQHAKFFQILAQIALSDIVFPPDSVITAVGSVAHFSIMVIAILLSIGVMLFPAKPIGHFNR